MYHMQRGGRGEEGARVEIKFISVRQTNFTCSNICERENIMLVLILPPKRGCTLTDGVSCLLQKLGC